MVAGHVQAERIDLLLSLASFPHRREQAHLAANMLGGAPEMQGVHRPLFRHRYGGKQVNPLYQLHAMLEEIEERERLLQVVSRR